MIGCLRRDDLESAKLSNDRVLAVLPDNLIGLWCRIEFLAVAKSLFDYPIDYKETLAKLKRVARDEKEILIAKAGVAAMYRMAVSSSAADKSCRLYDEVFDEVNRLPVHVIRDPVFRDLVATWKLDLSLNYCSQAMSQKMTDRPNGTSELDTLYGKATRLLTSVAEDERIANKIRAESFVLLATARKSLTSSSRDRLREDVTSFDWLKRAGYLDPDNLDTSLKIAGCMRRCATTVNEIKNVIERLKLCLEGVHKRNVVCHHLGLAYRSLWKLCNNFPSPPLRNRLRSSRGISSLPIGYKVTALPRSMLDPKMIPKPYKGVPKSTLLRHSNPLAETENDAYLLEARKYFKKADNLGRGSDGLMLVEIARTYLSAGNIPEAERCFSRASERQNIANSAAYLFEQMGMLKESQLNDDDDDDDHYSEKLEELKSIYREAIRYDARSTHRAEMAYHRLLDILYYQTQSSRANLIVQSEYFLIYTALQRARCHNEVTKAMISDENQISFMWRLIELLHRRNEGHDASAAFAYISVLAENDKLITEDRGTELSVREKLRILLKSGEKVALERPVLARYLPQTYDWLRQLDDSATGVGASSGMRSVAVIVDEIDSENLATVQRILVRQLKREYPPIISISDDTETDELIIKMRKFHSIVVITEEIDHNSRLFRLLEAVSTDGNSRRIRMCLAVFDVSNDRNDILQCPCLPEWRVESVVTSPQQNSDARTLSPSDRCKINEIKNACRLLRALFRHYA